MKLNLNFLADNLSQFHPSVLLHEIPVDSSVRNIFIMRRDMECIPDYAYLVDGANISRLRRCNAELPLSFIIFGNIEPDVSCFSERWNILFLHTGGSRAAIYDGIQRFLARYIVWYERFSDAVLSGASLQEQLDLGVGMLKNPIALYDVSYFLLGWAGEVPADTDDPIWSFAIANEYAAVENIPEELRDELDKNMLGSLPSIVPPLDEESDMRIIQAPLYHEEKLIGFLSMDDLAAPFTLGEASVVFLVKSILEQSPALLDALSFSGSGTSHVFSQLLSGEDVSEDILGHMAAHYRWKNGEAYRIWLAASAWGIPLSETNASVYEKKIRQSLAGFSVFYAKNRLILIEHGAKPEKADERTPFLINKMDSSALWYGVSMVFYDYERIALAVGQAERALGRASGDYTTIFFENAWQKALLEDLKKTGAPLIYCHPSVFRFRMENEWDRELFRTLRTFLGNNLHPTETARALHLHRNTLLNRIRRIEELLELDFSEMGDSLKEQLTFSCFLISMEERQAES